MRRCPNCGEAGLDDANYCGECGMKVEEVDAVSSDDNNAASDATVRDEQDTTDTVSTENTDSSTESSEKSKKEPMNKKRIAIIVFGIIYFLIKIFGSDGDDGNKNHFPTVSNTAVVEEFYDKATGIWVDKNTVHLSNGHFEYIYVVIEKNCIMYGQGDRICGRQITDVERVSNNKYRIHVREVEVENGDQGTQEIVFSGGKMYFTHADKQKFSRISHSTDDNDFIQVEREMRDYYRHNR